MKIHEYQARKIFRDHGLPVPPERVAETPEEAGAAARDLNGPVVIKAQVHVGGRGKAGGVKLASDPASAQEASKAILGMDIKGLEVRKVLIAPAVDIEHEAYVGIIVDRASQRPVLMVSAAGGVDIEEVARETPEKIHKAEIDPRYGLLNHQAMALGFALYDDLPRARAAAMLFRGLYEAFRVSDASLAEVNPLVVTKQGELQAIDAKMNLDDNALFRHQEFEELRDPASEEPAETMAREKGLSYVKLDGTVGCIVNGAGLAMATMDLIKVHGGEPANFLDVGGTATAERVTAAFELILSNERARAVLVNIFGGIVRCDIIAEGIVQAVRKVHAKVPVIVRLEGTNADQARKLLAASGLAITPARDLTDAATKAVRLARRGAAQ